VIGPDRAQLRWEMVDLDIQLPNDRRARLVWRYSAFFGSPNQRRIVFTAASVPSSSVPIGRE